MCIRRMGLRAICRNRARLRGVCSFRTYLQNSDILKKKYCLKLRRPLLFLLKWRESYNSNHKHVLKYLQSQPAHALGCDRECRTVADGRSRSSGFLIALIVGNIDVAFATSLKQWPHGHRSCVRIGSAVDNAFNPPRRETSIAVHRTLFLQKRRLCAHIAPDM